MKLHKKVGSMNSQTADEMTNYVVLVVVVAAAALAVAVVVVLADAKKKTARVRCARVEEIKNTR